MNNNTDIKVILHLTTFKKEYFAVFYDASVLFSCLEKSKKKALRKEGKRKMKAEKVPLLQRSQYMDDFWLDYQRRYRDMTREEIICENNENFEVRYSQIEQVKLSPYRTHTRNPNETPPIAGQLWVNTYHENYHFNHQYKREHENVDMLRALFGDQFILMK